MWTDNLVLNNSINIPSNFTNFFIFQKHWDYSQKIIFNNDNVNLENLYAILQSYLWNTKLRTIKLYTIKINKDNEKNIIVLSYSNVFLIKKMNYFVFSQWWDERTGYDKQYIQKEDLYGILIIFSKSSFESFSIINNVEINNIYITLKPKYPWNESIQNYFKYFK